MFALLDRTMLAVKKLRPAAGLDWVPGTPVPALGPRDVLVAVTHAGICGTDRHIDDWDAWSQGRVRVGVTVGHEFVGRVVALGDAVTRARLGDRVSAEGHIGCGGCEPCRTGKGHICDRVEILGVDRNGCFAQFVAVPEDNLWHVHPNIPDHVAAIFDPLGNAMHTVMAAGVSGRSVLITGVGPIGLMAVTIARAAGASKILVTDTDQRRLDLAEELGADLVFLATNADWPREARLATHGRGPQVLLEMSGHPTAIAQGFTALSNGGTAALLGIPSRPVEFDLPRDVIFKGATLLGINGRKMYETWYQVEDFLLSGRINLEPIITHQLPLQDYRRGLDLMRRGDAVKVVLCIPHEDLSLCQTSHSTSARASS